VWYGFGVQRFTLDPSIGEFILTALDLEIPAKPKTIYSINDGNYVTWDENMQRAVDKFKFNEPTPYTARYVGSMVADVHRTLLYGGIYLYPADKKKGPSLPCPPHLPLILLPQEMANSASCTKASQWRYWSRRLGAGLPLVCSAGRSPRFWILFPAVSTTSALSSWAALETFSECWGSMPEERSCLTETPSLRRLTSSPECRYDTPLPVHWCPLLFVHFCKPE
jgi:hypothetical protein